MTPEQLDVVELLRGLQKLERNASVALMYSGLRVPQFRMLAQLEAVGRATVTELSERLHITRATASVMANELIAAGIVLVEENPTDRRSFYILLTENGMNKLHVARSDLAVMQGKLSQRMSQEMIRTLNEFASWLEHK